MPTMNNNTGSMQAADLSVAMAAAEPTTARMTPRQAIQTFADIKANYEDALSTPGGYGDVLKYYEQAVEWENKVLKPSGLSKQMQTSARYYDEDGEREKAEHVRGFSANGLARIAAQPQYNVNIRELQDKMTAKGVFAQNPYLPMSTADMVARYRRGEMEQDDPNFARAMEITHILDTSGGDGTAVRSSIAHLDASFTALASIAPTTTEGAPAFSQTRVGVMANELARATRDTGLDLAQAKATLTSLYDAFTPSAQEARESGETSSENWEAAAFNQAISTFSKMAKVAPQYMPEASRFLSGGYIKDMSILNKGLNSVAMAAYVSDLAPKLRSIQGSVGLLITDPSPQGDIDRQALLENMTYLAAKDTPLFEPDSRREAVATKIMGEIVGANAALQQALESGADISSTAYDGAVNIAASATGTSPEHVEAPILAKAVEQGVITEEGRTEYENARQVETAARQDPNIGLLQGMVTSTDKTLFAGMLKDRGESVNTFSGDNANELNRALGAALEDTQARAPAYDSPEANIAKAMGLTLSPDGEGPVFPAGDFEMQDRYEEAIRIYKAAFENVLNPRVQDTARDLEQYAHRMGAKIAAIPALFTSSDYEKSTRRHYLDQSTRIKGVDFEHRLLFDSYEEVDEVLQSTFTGKANSEAFRKCFDRAVTRGLYKWDPKTNWFVRDSKVKVEKFRAVQGGSGSNPVATLTMPTDATGTGTFEYKLDLKDPRNRVVGADALVFSPDTASKKSAKEQWDAVVSAAYKRGDTAYNYRGAKQTISTVSTKLMHSSVVDSNQAQPGGVTDAAQTRDGAYGSSPYSLLKAMQDMVAVVGGQSGSQLANKYETQYQKAANQQKLDRKEMITMLTKASENQLEALAKRAGLEVGILRAAINAGSSDGDYNPAVTEQIMLTVKPHLDKIFGEASGSTPVASEQ